MQVLILWVRNPLGALMLLVGIVILERGWYLRIEFYKVEP